MSNSSTTINIIEPSTKNLDQLQHIGKWVVKFGKNKGKTYSELIKSDKKYLEWMVKQNTINNPDLLRFLQLSFAV